jgi:hypothetical protein
VCRERFKGKNEINKYIWAKIARLLELLILLLLFLVVGEIELRTMHLLGKHSTASTMPPVLFLLACF